MIDARLPRRIIINQANNEANNILGVEQAEFREKFYTIDHFFTLHSFIEFYKSSKEEAVLCFY